VKHKNICIFGATICFNNETNVNKVLLIKKLSMAKNGTPNDNHRNGAVKNRSQVYNEKIERFVKRDSETGRFMDVKSDDKPFKGVRKEK